MVNAYVIRISKVLGKFPRRTANIIGIVLFAVIGSALLLEGHALTPTSSVESETGTIAGCATAVTDNSASGGGAIKFASCASSASDPSAGAGASLPLQYNLSSLTGTVVYVSPLGSDSNAGTVGAPFATLAKGVSAAPAGGTVVLRGGNYSQGNVYIGKALKVIAYPGETPVFDGAQAVSNSSGWTTSGSTSYHAYTPMPVTDGSGISFTTCQNQTGSCMGKYADQAWIGTQQLQQVATQAAVTAGKFYVDSANSRIYLATTDVSTGGIEISNLRHFISVQAPNVTLSGFKVIRYSNAGGDYGVFIIYGVADNFLMDNMFTSDSAFMAISVVTDGGDTNDHSTIQNSTISYGNWMGVAIDGTNYFKLDHDKLSDMNQFNEFTSSPQSGALKTGKTWYTMVLNNQVLDNNSQGIWFDESNYKAEVAGNYMDGNAGSALFYEISDYVYVVNNYIRASGGAKAVKLAASSDLYMVNNTIVGGADPVGVYVDSRSIPGCSTYTNPSQCSYDGAGQDSYHTHPVTMTWLPSINLFVNNIFAYPTSAGYCTTTTVLCVTHSNANATVAVNTIIHQADSGNNIPQTLIDGNVYANGAGNIVNLESLGNYTTTSAFASAAAGSPINISGFETHGLVGNGYVNNDGSPTSALISKHSSALSVPTDATINKYVPAGTQHYGVLWK